MANPRERNDAGARLSDSMPAWAKSMRVTKEQLAAAQRTRDYHMRKLQARITSPDRANQSPGRSEH